MHAAARGPRRRDGRRRAAAARRDARPACAPAPPTTLATARCSGRGDQADIRLEDPFASVRHARLVPHGDVIVLEDLGSTNGTYLNGEPLRGPQPLHPGDQHPHRRLRVHLRAMSSMLARSPSTSRSRRPTSGRQRQGNEDTYFVRAPLFVVADGMGGAQAGEVASEIAVEVVRGGPRRRRRRAEEPRRA